MIQFRPSDPLCDCNCPVHYRSLRPAFNNAGCTCLLTCSTQPVTLVVKEWGCGLFLHPGSGQLWFVMSVAPGKWDWESANEIDDRADVFDISRKIGTLLLEITSVIA